MPTDGYMDAAAVPVPDAGDDLTRRAIIAAHDAECVCGSERYGDHRGLTEAEEAIVALWRADVEEKSAEIDDKSRIGHAAADAWMDKAQKTEAAIERVRELHSREGSAEQTGFCGKDGYPWPCSTIRALDGTEADHA